jgi:hypothetical protein
MIPPRLLNVSTPLQPADDGWYHWLDAPPQTFLSVWLDQADDGRYHVAGLHIQGQLSANDLRAIPLGRIEAAANALLHGHEPLAPGSGRRRPVKARIPEKLRRTGVRGYPEEFYDAVAGAYRRLVAHSSRPIAELAESNDVPVTTAQRWVREARARGKLPPGRPGKSG